MYEQPIMGRDGKCCKEGFVITVKPSFPSWGNDGGDVEVVDAKGSVRYTDKGEPLGVDDLVREFLDSNPHFKLANPATTNTKSNIVNKASAKIDIAKLDMNNPEHRAAYKEHRKSIGLR